ncbi:hypothetical protein M758_5G141700 [Ceratodon purpureus]|nr:hypothetical protein M758_5G141700 [Ceratodon purpureus]
MLSSIVPPVVWDCNSLVALFSRHSYQPLHQQTLQQAWSFSSHTYLLSSLYIRLHFPSSYQCSSFRVSRLHFRSFRRAHHYQLFMQLGLARSGGESVRRVQISG